MTKLVDINTMTDKELDDYYEYAQSQFVDDPTWAFEVEVTRSKIEQRKASRPVTTDNSERIAALRAALDKTTQGEWVWGQALNTSRIVVFEDYTSLELREIVVSSIGDNNNAAFIALAHNELPALLAYVASVEAERDRLRAFVQGFIDEQPASKIGATDDWWATKWLEFSGEAKELLEEVKP